MRDYVIQIKFRPRQSDNESAVERLRSICEEQVDASNWTDVSFSCSWRDKIEREEPELYNESEVDDFATL